MKFTNVKGSVPYRSSPTATKALNQAVSRNRERFPEDFLFVLSTEEFDHLRSQIVTPSRGGRRYPPRAFTEMGVAMLSSVLRSKRAIEVNIDIMRTFARLRQVLASHDEVARKLEQHDREIGVLFKHVERLLTPPTLPASKKIGFRGKGEE